jgi:hypothetical protein
MGDSAAPAEAKGDNKPGLWDRIRNWRFFGRGVPRALYMSSYYCLLRINNRSD